MSVHLGVSVAESVNNISNQEIVRRIGWVQKDMAILSNEDKSRAVPVLHKVREIWHDSKSSLLALEKFVNNPLPQTEDKGAVENALKDKLAASALSQCFYDVKARVNLVVLRRLRVGVGNDAFFQQVNKCKLKLPDREIIDFFTSIPGDPRVFVETGSSGDRVFESIQNSDL